MIIIFIKNTLSIPTDWQKTLYSNLLRMLKI